MTKVLVVEDNELNCEVVVRKLERLGYAVRACPDAESAFAMLAAERPDVILMDLSLPGIDGLQATVRLKADDATRQIPVVALTAHAMESDRLRALAAGCDAYLSKPIDFPELDATIKRLIA